MHPVNRILKIGIYTLSALATFALGFMIQGKDGSSTAHMRLDSSKNPIDRTVTFGTPVAFADIPSDDSSCGTCASCGVGDGTDSGGGDGCDSDGDGDCGE